MTRKELLQHELEAERRRKVKALLEATEKSVPTSRKTGQEAL